MNPCLNYNQMRAFLKCNASIIKIVANQFNSLNKRPNLYSLLQLREDASSQEIRYNYYKLMSQYQPQGVAPNEGLKHSRLLNQAYAILSNQKLRQKYDSQHGFNTSKHTKKEPQKIKLSLDIQADIHLKQAKKGISASIGDKKTRLHQKILTIFAVGMLVTTILMMLTGKEYKKQVLRRSQQKNKS